MAFISTIDIQNFKFFRANEQFILDGKNLLIYGENGSGKSSLYWALYTLLECANKEDDASINKYFTGAAALANVFMEPGDADYVECEINLALDDGSSFKLAVTDLSIRTNVDAQAANYASEFLNYRMLFSIHDFVHGETIDLFDYFRKDVLPYVKYAPVRYWKKDLGGNLVEHETENANQIWEFAQTGPPKSSFDKNRKPKFPSTKEPDSRTYRNIVNGFKQETQDLLTYINTEGNPILVTDFDGDFEFHLDLVEMEAYKVSPQNFAAPKFEITLTVSQFHGVGVLPNPQSFLNEARLSALALAIRFAILKRRLQTAKLKLAVLDDFMISLDMNNRDVALNYVFDKIIPAYQVILLTHDRYFYEMAKDRIKRKTQSNVWVTYEMFEAFDDENDPKNSKPKPCIIEDKGKVNKARSLYRSKDYASAANMVRQATEKLCKSYLTRQEMLDVNYGVVNLAERINRLVTKATAAGIDPVLLANLMHYKGSLMDLGSHHNIEAPLFRNELFKAIETLERLKGPTQNPDL